MKQKILAIADLERIDISDWTILELYEKFKDSLGKNMEFADFEHKNGRVYLVSKLIISKKEA